MKIPFWMVRSSGFHDQVWQGRRPQTLIDPVNPVNPVPQDAAQMGLWVSEAKNGDPGTHWVGIPWITLGYQMISNDDIHPLGWISRACLRRWFQAGCTHRLAKGNHPLFLKKSAYPRKGIQPTNSINYHSKMAMFYGQPPWPLKFLLPKEQLDFSSTPQPADWFQVTALGNQKVLTCVGNYRKTQEISPPKR